jgi:hypothetical protein
MGAGNTLRWQEQPELRRRLDQLIAGIKACQTADGRLLVPGVGNKLDKQWGYSMQMFAHGMVAAARSGNADAYPLLAAAHRDYASLLRAQPPGFALTTDLNYQGHIASLLVHLSPVGTPDDLRLAEQCFVSEPWREALAARRPEAIWRDSPKWPHCYEIVAFEAYLDHYRATGDQRYLKAMLGAWELLRESWRDVGGTIAISEHQKYPPKCYPLSRKRFAGEFCGSVFWIRFNHRLQQLFPDDERYTDETHPQHLPLRQEGARAAFGERGSWPHLDTHRAFQPADGHQQALRGHPEHWPAIPRLHHHGRHGWQTFPLDHRREQAE